MSDVARRLGSSTVPGSAGSAPAGHASAAPSASGKLQVDSGWLELYAKRVDDAAEELTAARGELQQTPLGTRTFGEVGRTLRSAEAYGRAAQLLHQQLDRACEVLKAAGKGLHDVAGHYGGSESEAVHAIKKVDRR
jgi:uncharacterized protein YukE